MPNESVFESFIKSFKSAWGWAAAAITAGPVALFAGGFAPPWPNESGSMGTVVGVVAGIVGLVIAYRVNADNPKWRRYSIVSMIAGFVMVMVFLALWSWLVVPIPQMVEGVSVERRFVVGFFTRAVAADLEAKDAIMTFGLDRAYSPISLLLGRMSLIFSWASAIFLLTFGFALQVADARAPGDKR